MKTNSMSRDGGKPKAGKRKNYFAKSTGKTKGEKPGYIEVRGESPWNPGGRSRKEFLASR